MDPLAIPTLISTGAKIVSGIVGSNNAAKKAANFKSDINTNGSKLYESLDILTQKAGDNTLYVGLVDQNDIEYIRQAVDTVLGPQVTQNPYQFNHDSSTFRSKYARYPDGRPVDFSGNDKAVAQIIDQYLDQKKSAASLTSGVLLNQPSLAQSQSPVQQFIDFSQIQDAVIANQAKATAQNSYKPNYVAFALIGGGLLLLTVLILRK